MLSELLPSVSARMALGSILLGGTTMGAIGVSEQAAGALAGVALALVGSAIVLRQLAAPMRTNLGIALAITLASLTLTVTILPIARTLMPGRPAYRGEVGLNQALPIPRGPDRDIRLLVQGNLGGEGHVSVAYEFSGAAQPIRGKLERVLVRQRLGKRGSTTATKLHDTQFRSAHVESAHEQLRLVSLNGAVRGPLHVDIFEESVPWGALVILAALVQLAVALLSARAGIESTATIVAAMTMAFGAGVYQFANPKDALNPEIGALFIAGIYGLVVGGGLAWSARLLFRRMSESSKTPIREARHSRRSSVVRE